MKFVVVEAELTPLLSRKAAEKMKLITVNYDKFESINGVVEGQQDVLKAFPDVFNGDIGTLPGSVRLTIKPNAEPVLRPPKRLPVELRDQVKQEPDRLVGVGVLAPVDEPTDWVNQMAIATKRDGSLRICIDPRSLNLALKREHYQLPVLDDILPDLAKAKVFSKVDLSHALYLGRRVQSAYHFLYPILEVQVETSPVWTLLALRSSENGSIKPWKDWWVLPV